MGCGASTDSALLGVGCDVVSCCAACFLEEIADRRSALCRALLFDRYIKKSYPVFLKLLLLLLLLYCIIQWFERWILL